jgi:hypothetical protein
MSSRQAFPLHVRQGVSLSMSFRAKRGTSLFSSKMRCFASLSMTRMSPRAQASPSALACLGMPRWRMLSPNASQGGSSCCRPDDAPRRQPRGLFRDLRDVVPSEARDASLSLGTTDQETFLKQSLTNLKLGLH